MYNPIKELLNFRKIGRNIKIQSQKILVFYPLGTVYTCIAISNTV